MYHPNELIKDIQAKLDHMVRNYRTLLETNQKLETENKALAASLEEAVKQQETLTQKLESLLREQSRDTKGLDQWKTETRKELRGIIRELEKCMPQVETLLEK